MPSTYVDTHCHLDEVEILPTRSVGLPSPGS